MYEMPNYLARMMTPQQYQSYAPTTQSNAFAAAPMAGANYQRFASNMSPEDEMALFQEMRAYQTRRNPVDPLKFIYGNVRRNSTGRGRDPMPLNFDLFSQALPRRGAVGPDAAAPAGDGMLGGVGRLARYEAFKNPRPNFNPTGR